MKEFITLATKLKEQDPVAFYEVKGIMDLISKIEDPKLLRQIRHILIGCTK